jgi:hypothetical protein
MDSVAQERAILEGRISVGILVPSDRPVLELLRVRILIKFFGTMFLNRPCYSCPPNLRQRMPINSILISRKQCSLAPGHCALTFDDGPAGKVTFGVKACFCLVGLVRKLRPGQDRLARLQLPGIF